MLPAILALISGILVAIISHVLAERRNRRNDLIEYRLKAYSDFINTVSRLMADRRLGKTENELRQLAFLNDAKTRICICAEAPVVEALSEFWLAGGTLEKESEVVAFTRLCTRVRESLGNKRYDIMDLKLSDVLFRLEPSSDSYRAGKLGSKS